MNHREKNRELVIENLIQINSSELPMERILLKSS